MSKIKQFWIVAPLDIKEDTQQGRVAAQGGFEAMDVPEPAARPGRGRVGELQQAPAGNGFGYKIQSSDLKRMSYAFTTKQSAQDYAKESAEKNPKILFGVFECGETFETTTPTIIKKKFNDDGELVMGV